MRLILLNARPTLAYYRGEDEFLKPDYQAYIDPSQVIVLEGVTAFFSDHQGFLVTFKSPLNAQAAFEQTGWVQDPRQELITLFTRYDFGQRCIFVNRVAYMDWRLEEGAL